MAAKFVFLFFLSVLLRVSFSLPISLSEKAVQSTDSVPESGLTGSKPVLDSEKILRHDEELVQSLSTETLLKAFESFEADHGERTKRDIAKSFALCPGDTYKCQNFCVTKEQYEDCEDGPDEYDENR